MQFLLFASTAGSGSDLVRYALNQSLFRPGFLQTAYHGFVRRTRGGRFSVENVPLVPGDRQVVIPACWSPTTGPIPHAIISEEKGIAKSLWPTPVSQGPWVVLSDGRFATHLNYDLLHEQLNRTDADVVAIVTRPDLLGYRERFLLTQDLTLAGVRRFYEDSIEYQPFRGIRPHHLLIRPQVFTDLARDMDYIPGDLATWTAALQNRDYPGAALGIAGQVLDLYSPSGFLSFWLQHLEMIPIDDTAWNYWDTADKVLTANHGALRVAGRVWVHKEAVIDPDVSLIGPCWIGAAAHLGHGCVVERAMIGAGTEVPAGEMVSSRVYLHTAEVTGETTEYEIQPKNPVFENPFKCWPRFSYAALFKRWVDIVAASLILILFLPVFPVIALAIKLNSPGPVFFGARRQGLHGKEFRCLKFRSMKPGADKLQEQLRAVNEVDGPQFKMADDPRISAVGRFLRETYLDEIPQFINVLRGQMSIVGPRPSPKRENTQCPAWRDARLSVRPGVTGLWQVKRTRDPVKDFQEWIQYDIEYVRKLSFKIDLWICWATFKSMLDKFTEQF